MKKLFGLLLGALLLMGMVGCGSSDDDNFTKNNDVTLEGSMAVGSGGAAALTTSYNHTSHDPLLYKLLCVTFTDPPETGSGDFDVDGNFSVTVNNAAGIPVGCFIILRSTNASVATLTFTVGTASGLDDGTSSAASLDSGTYAITINFDPDTGVATSDITEIIVASGSTTTSSLDPASVVGGWNMSCSTANDTVSATACNDFMTEGDPNAATEMPLYFDVISATVNAETKYAFGVWASRAAYIAAGATEGIPSNLPAEVTNIISLNGDVTLDVDGVTPSAQGEFLGFMTEATYTRETIPETGREVILMIGDDVVAALEAIGVTYDPNHNDQWMNQGDTDWCPNADTAWTDLDLATNEGRDCLLGGIEFLRDGGGAGMTVPRLHQRSWMEYARPMNPDGSQATLDVADKIGFETTQIAGTAAIHARFAFMDMSLQGQTVVARNFSQYQYPKWDDNAGAEIICDFNEELTVTILPTSTAVMDGWFTVSQHNNCEPDQNGYFNFMVDFAAL